MNDDLCLDSLASSERLRKNGLDVVDSLSQGEKSFRNWIFSFGEALSTVFQQ